MKNLYFILVIFSISVLDSCKTSNNSDFEVLEGEIISISCPEKAISGDNVDVIVQFRGMNGCSEGFTIKANTVGQTVTLSAFYKQPLNTKYCNEISPVHTLTYSFFTDFAGVHFFQSAQNNSIADTLTVY